MTFKTIIQNELREKKRLFRKDVYDLAYKHEHDFDTARRHLEKDKIPFSRKITEGKRIKFWDYVPEMDNRASGLNSKPINALESPVSPNNASLNERLKEILDSTELYWKNKTKVDEVLKALESKNNLTKEAVIRKYEQ